MSNHQIKINRSRKLAPALPAADQEIMASISGSLLDSLTGAQLAEVRNCLNNHWHKAVAHTECRIVSDGYVWSAKDQVMFNVSQGNCNG